MPDLTTVEYPPLVGGVNFQVPASAIADNELAAALNMRPSAGRLVTRGGARQLFQLPQPALGMATVKRAGSWAGVVLGSSQATWFGQDYVPHSFDNLGTFGDSSLWSVAVWNDTIYAARGVDSVRRIRLSPDYAYSAGVASPTFALTATDSGVGSLTAGAYQYVCTYYSTSLGIESSYGPVSNTVTIGALRQISLSGFVASLDPAIDSIRIYRTLPNSSGAWYFVATVIAKAVDERKDDAAYTDNVAVENQGALLASNTNNPPPSGSVAIAIWRGRLWVTDGRFVYPSKLLNPEAFNLAEAVEIGPDDAERVASLLATDDRLLIGKRHSVWALTGTGIANWEIRPIDPVHGVVSNTAMCYYGGLAIWTSDDDLYASEGSSPGSALSGAGKRKLSPIFQRRTDDVSRIVPSARGNGVYVTLSQTVLAADFFLYDMPTTSYWPMAGPVSSPLYPLHSSLAYDDRPVTWGHGAGNWLFELDDELYEFDDEPYPSAGPPTRRRIDICLAPKALNLKSRRGLIRRVRLKWGVATTRDVLWTTWPVPLDGNMQVTVWRDALLGQSYDPLGMADKLQPARVIRLYPDQELDLDGVANRSSEQAFAVPIQGVPSSTLLVFLDGRRAVVPWNVQGRVGIDALKLEVAISGHRGKVL